MPCLVNVHGVHGSSMVFHVACCWCTWAYSSVTVGLYTSCCVYSCLVEDCPILSRTSFPMASFIPYGGFGFLMHRSFAASDYLLLLGHSMVGSCIALLTIIYTYGWTDVPSYHVYSLLMGCVLSLDLQSYFSLSASLACSSVGFPLFGIVPSPLL